MWEVQQFRQYLGQKNDKMCNQPQDRFFLTVIVISGTLMLVCLIFCKPLLRLVFGAVEEDVMNGAVRYFLITVIAYPFLALFDVGRLFIVREEISDSR